MSARAAAKTAAKSKTGEPSGKPVAGKTNRATNRATDRATDRASAKRSLPGDGVSLYTVEEAAERLRVGRTLVYYLVGKGKIDSLKIEGLRRITREGLERYVAEQVALTSRLGA